MLSRCAAVRGSRQGRENVLRSVDGGGEVDLDKRAITGDDDIVELDQLHSQHTEPPAAPHHCDHTLAEPAKPPGPTTGATPTTSTGQAKPPRRIVVLSDETGNEDVHSDRPIAAAPDHPTLLPAAPLPGTLPARPLPASEATSGSPAHTSRSRRDRSRLLPSPRTTLRRRPRLATGAAILVLALTAATAIALTAGGRDHRARDPRTTASAGATNSAPIPPTIRHVAINAARQPARAKRRTNRRQPHVEATSPLGRRLRAGDGRRDPCVRRDNPLAGLELHADQRRLLANPAKRAPADKQRHRRHPPTNSRRTRAVTRPSRQKPR